MIRRLTILAAAVAVAAAVLTPAPAQAQAQPETVVKAAEPKKDDKPLVDYVKDLIDTYSQGDERGRFFQGAGVDGEITKEEFAAAAGKAGSFVRSYDRWDSAAAHDLDKSGKLNWPEAEKYRLGVQALVLSRFDKDKDGKLAGAERDAANRMLARGLPRERRRAWTITRWDRDKDGKISDEERVSMDADRDQWRKRQEEWTRRWDADKDGKLGREELETAAKSMREEYEKKLLDKWDANKDGQLDDDERQAMRDAWQKRMAEQMDARLLRRHDKDGDGKLNEDEQAAADAERAKWDKRREEWQKRAEEWRKRLDTDGDGKVSDEERRAVFEKARAEWDRRRKEMDTDGDGKVSREEGQAYLKKIQDKYDADGDGKLNDEERKKMIETEAGRFMGGSVSVIRGGAGGQQLMPIRTAPGETTYVSEGGSMVVTVRRPAPEGDE